jgi:hypothetical protein
MVRYPSFLRYKVWTLRRYFDEPYTSLKEIDRNPKCSIVIGEDLPLNSLYEIPTNVEDIFIESNDLFSLDFHSLTFYRIDIRDI